MYELTNDNYKYRLHDIRKDPKDLPGKALEEEDLLVYNRYDDGTVLTEIKFGMFFGKREYPVDVAWRLIPPLEE